MTDSCWDPIDGFRSRPEFECFVAWLQQQVQQQHAQEMVVMRPYMDVSGFKEAWFREDSSGKTWRLVWPEPPFDGVFELV